MGPQRQFNREAEVAVPNPAGVVSRRAFMEVGLGGLVIGFDLFGAVDALPRGGQPGELFVVEPDMEQLEDFGGPAVADGHGMDPVTVLKMVRQFGGTPPRLYVVGCEPASLGGEQGEMGLSPPVEAALDGALTALRAAATPSTG